MAKPPITLPAGFDDGTPLVIVFDTTNLIHRSYHALTSTQMTRRDGSPVWALHGLGLTYAKFVDVGAPRAIVSALDGEGGCPFRRNLAPEYKQGRSKADDALKAQLKEAPALLSAAGLGATIVPGWEADDILASTARAANDRGWRTIIVTSDRDAYQLVDDRTLLIKPDGVVVDTQWLHDRLGVGADGYRHLAALRGEQSDNLTGVPGIGDKTAAKLLGVFPDVDAALADPDRLRSTIGPSAAGKIVEHAAVYRRNLDVATLRADLPVDEALNHELVADDIRSVFTSAGLPVAGNKLATAVKASR